MPNSTPYNPISNNLRDSPVLQPSQIEIPHDHVNYQRYYQGIQIGDSPTNVIRILCNGISMFCQEHEDRRIYSTEQRLEILKSWIRTDINSENRFSYMFSIERIDQLMTYARGYLESSQN